MVREQRFVAGNEITGRKVFLEVQRQLLGLDFHEPTPEAPGSSPAKPLYVSQVGYDVNLVMEDPEIRRMVLELDARMRALTGGEGIVIDEDGERVE